MVYFFLNHRSTWEVRSQEYMEEYKTPIKITSSRNRILSPLLTFNVIYVLTAKRFKNMTLANKENCTEFQSTTVVTQRYFY